MLGNGVWGAVGHHITAVDSGSGSHIHYIVGGANGVFIMLDHDDAIAEIAQPNQGLQQPVIVSLVQADRGFVEDIHDADQACANLTGEANPLGLAAREGLGAAV